MPIVHWCTPACLWGNTSIWGSLPKFSTGYIAILHTVHYGKIFDTQPFDIQCTMGKQVYTSALWASRCTPVHHRQSGVHQCTMGNQGYTSALWAIRCTPVHHRQSGVHQCTIGNQVYTSAPWAIRCTPVHYGQSGVHQCTIGNQGYTSAL